MRKTTLISDFDNTLYDWFQMWHQSFTAMLDEIERISGISRSILIPQIRTIHQRYGTSEYAFLIEHIPVLQSKYPGSDLGKIFDSAIHAYRSVRNSSLKLYDGVFETLDHLHSRNVTIVLYTDSLAFYTADRVKRLGLDGLVDYVFSPPDHEIPDSITSHTQRDKYRFAHTSHRYLPEGVIKPNPEVLLDILSDIGRTRGESVYLGDSLMRDVAMAQDARVADVYAEYGVVQNHEGYSLLREVSHWTDEDIEREKVISKRTVVPTSVISAFKEIIQFYGN